MKSLLSIAVFVVFALATAAQDHLNYPDAYYYPAPGPDKYYADSVQKSRGHGAEQPKLSYNLSLGTSFMSGGYTGGGFSSWLAPEMTYRAADNFDLSLGVMFSRNSFNGSDYFPVAETGNSWFSTTVYASGRWYVSPKLIVTGSVLKTMDETPNHLKNTIFDNSRESMSLSVDYRLSNSVSFGVRVSTDRSNNPWMMHQPPGSFGHDPFYSPFIR